MLRWAVLSFHAASAALAFLAVPLFVLATGGWTAVARQAAIAGILLGVGALGVCVLAGDLLHARERRARVRPRRAVRPHS